MIHVASYVADGTLGNALIRAWCRRRESHTELLLDGTCYAASLRDGGVRSRPAAEVLANPAHWVVEPAPWMRPADMLAHWHRTKGQPYDWLGLLGAQVFNRSIQGRHSGFCSEWAAAAGALPNPEIYNPGTFRDVSNHLTGLWLAGDVRTM